MFQDRTDAGEQLADRLTARGVEADLVLAIPRGALPVARPVADRLDVPLDIIAAKKMGMPGNEEFAIGAATSDGSVWLNDGIIERHGVGEAYIAAERERAAETAREKLAKYRGDRPAPDLAGKRVVVVDDGVATGATARACLRQVRGAGAERVVLAVPVGPPESLSDLESEADEVIAVEEPAHFGAVGSFYRDFGQVSDEEARQYLGWVSNS
ncbi:phosphoribosyltransferase [Haloglomus litoreum]|uniref:phosphoribosyltransferase n=1 Tax=Haloglomus litoreum TaxID=3034026 RepID=UPI0023E8DB22|nr:phosphoribosyltransferase family protein [Haloglomus sp. DT116]